MLQELEHKNGFHLAKRFAFEYVDQLDQKDVYPNETHLARLNEFDGQLDETSIPAETILTYLQNSGDC